MNIEQAKGAAREWGVVVDLLEKGFEVFKSVSVNCSCDLVVMKHGETLRVEVKGDTRTKIPRGNVIGCTAGHSNYDSRKFDVLAAVGSAGSPRYLRSIFHTPNKASIELTGTDKLSSKITHKNLELQKRRTNVYTSD